MLPVERTASKRMKLSQDVLSLKVFYILKILKFLSIKIIQILARRQVGLHNE